MNIKGLFNDIKNDNDIDSDFIKYLLWYSPSKQSYLKPKQAEIKAKNFRNYKEYLNYNIKNVLGINKINIEQKNTDWIRNKTVINDVIYINKNPDKVNLIKELIEGIRNSIAHGTVKIDGEYLVCMSQYKPKTESVINFFIKVRCNLIYDNLRILVDNYNSIEDNFNFKLFVIFNVHDRNIINSYEVEYNNLEYMLEACPDNKTINKKEALRLTNIQYPTKTIYLVNNTSNYKYENFKDKNENLEIMKIDDFFNKVMSNEIIIIK